MEEWEGDEREEVSVDTGLIHTVVQQKPAQDSKAIILHLKKKNTHTQIHECYAFISILIFLKKSGPGYGKMK